MIRNNPNSERVMCYSMNKILSIVLLVIICCLSSCNSSEDKQTSGSAENGVVSSGTNELMSDTVFQTDRSAITKDSKTWYNYTYYNVRLADDFIGLDIDSTVINKSTFLSKLLNGNVVAFKVKIVKEKPVYKLYNLTSNNESISSTIKQMAATEMEHFKIEGSQMPNYYFSDLNGKVYNNLSTKGKIVVLKCWFIHCGACVKEFPELNKLVDDNKNRDDILFVSLAIDSKEELVEFLKKKEFKYDIIPDMENFMTDKLNITAYPTHLLIDREGKIVKVANEVEYLVPLINREKLKTSL